MIGKVKYLNLFVLLAFLVGQVQYAYGSFFCTMKQMTVHSPEMAMTVNDSSENFCDECAAIVQSVSSGQSLNSNCMQVRVVQKMVVDNFTGAQKSIRHFVGFETISHQLSAVGYQPSANNYQLFAPADSPPLDIPTASSNLRI